VLDEIAIKFNIVRRILLRNQPSYHFFKNTTYALKGLKDIMANEKSFLIELVIFFLLILPILFLIDISLFKKLLLFGSYMLILVVEALNSAIERVVDLVTLEYHELAGQAKDVGSAAVFLSIVSCVVVWGTVFIDYSL
jgi:diacylglycerol kinase (ATP)